MSLPIVDIPSELTPYFTGQLKNSSSRAESVAGVSVAMMVLVLVAASLRLYFQFGKMHATRLEVIFIYTTLFCCLFLSISCLMGVRRGIGTHVWNLEENFANLPHRVDYLNELLRICYIAYAIATTFTKLTIATTYTLLYPQRLIRIALYFISCIAILLGITSIVCIAIGCFPGAKAWNTVGEEHCFSVITYLYVAAAFNALMNLMLAALPVQRLLAIWSMKPPPRQMLVVCMLIGLAWTGTAASIVRIVSLKGLQNPDISYGPSKSLIWGVVEVNTALLSANLPVMYTLFQRDSSQTPEMEQEQQQYPRKNSRWTSFAATAVDLETVQSQDNDKYNMGKNPESGVKVLQTFSAEQREMPAGSTEQPTLGSRPSLEMVPTASSQTNTVVTAVASTSDLPPANPTFLVLENVVMDWGAKSAWAALEGNRKGSGCGSIDENGPSFVPRPSLPVLSTEPVVSPWAAWSTVDMCGAASRKSSRISRGSKAFTEVDEDLLDRVQFM